jgi:hypothetical protein
VGSTCQRRKESGREKASGPGNQNQIKFDFFFKRVQTSSKLIQSKQGPPELKKIEIKYDCEGFEERNNFLHRNFSRFEVDFK